MAQVLDFIAQAYTAHSKPLNASQCVNFFAETELQDAHSKSPVAIWGAPGIAPFANTSDESILALNEMNGVVYAIGNRHLWSINQYGHVTDLGSHGANGQIGVDNNGVQLCWVDGSTGWYWQSGGSVTQIVDPNFYPSRTVTYFDGYFCFVRDGTKEFYISPLFGITPFDGSMFASKEATSDLLLAIANSHEQLFLFGQERCEVWFDAGNPAPQFPFQRSSGAIIQRGLSAVYSIVLEDNTVFFLGDDLIYYRLLGFQPQRVSNHALENEWQGYQTVSDCQACVYTVFGHKQIHLTFPTAKRTWVLDLATQRWHRRESWIGSNEDTSIGRWRGNCVLAAYDRILVGDSVTGQIGQINFEAYTEWGDTMRGLIDGPPIHQDRKRCFMRRFELDVETGVGLPEATQLEQLSYCLNPVEIIKPTTLTSAAPLPGMVANYANALFSVWLNLSGGSATGMILTNGGLTLQIQNNTVGAPELTLTAKDSAGATIVAATYDFATWTGWVNVMMSIGTATQQLEVWCNTIVAGVLVETQLTAVSLTWSSRNPVTKGGAWVLSVV